MTRQLEETDRDINTQMRPTEHRDNDLTRREYREFSPQTYHQPLSLPSHPECVVGPTKLHLEQAAFNCFEGVPEPP